MASIQAGVTSGDYFGYATSVTAQARYEGLVFGAPAAIYVDAESVLVESEAARAQIEAERVSPGAGGTEPGMTVPGTGADSSGVSPSHGTGIEPEPVTVRLPRRFFGTARLNPDRAGRDMGTVTEEVLQHLTTLPGAKVEVSVEISATVPDGVSENVQRIVDENCKTLRFQSHGFEEE